MMRRRTLGVLAFLCGIAAYGSAKWALDYTSRNVFCDSCHAHPQATRSWKLGPHADNRSGVVVDCAGCHLPPAGTAWLTAKIQSGARDVFGMLTKNPAEIDWEFKSQLEQALGHVYEASCLHCHSLLFPPGLAEKGQKAHLHYSRNKDSVRCLNCHLDVGHRQPGSPTPITTTRQPLEVFTEPARVDSFIDFVEKIPGTHVQFEMIAISGGTFIIGSPPDEPYREADEGPQRRIRLGPFWMGKTEVSWEEFDAFYRETSGQGRSEDQQLPATGIVDAVTGPTPPYGNPDQGWGRGRRPAITMTHAAAVRYCEWLSEKTGKRYRLPTEAEWEYAARGGTTGPYYFDADPRDFDTRRLLNRLFGVDSRPLDSLVVFALNSGGRTALPSSVKPNPFGLLHMLGNVREFCGDWYAPDAYAAYPAGAAIDNPCGPADGVERVVRGGSYRSTAGQLRVANRDHTQTAAWQRTDPQIPKSLWWYSDCRDVGFRVVCDYGEKR